MRTERNHCILKQRLVGLQKKEKPKNIFPIVEILTDKSEKQMGKMLQKGCIFRRRVLSYYRKCIIIVTMVALAEYCLKYRLAETN